jgi:hypothetical protein
MPADWLLARNKIEVTLTPGSLCRQPVQVGVLVFPSYRAGAPAELSPCPPVQAVAELLQGCWNFAAHREDVVGYVCDLVGRVPAVRLSFSDGDLAAEFLTRSRLMAEPLRESAHARTP